MGSSIVFKPAGNAKVDNASQKFNEKTSVFVNPARNQVELK